MAARPNVAMPRSRRSSLRRTLAAVAGIIVIGGILALTGTLARIEQVIPGLAPPRPSYQTSIVRRGDLTVGVTATGPLAPVSSIPLTFKTSGRLAELRVGVGDHVNKGQVLAVLDPTDLQAALDQAKSTLDQVQANAAKVEKGPTSAQKDVAQASLDSAKSSATIAAAAVDTTKVSVADDLDTAQQSVKTAELSLVSAQHALDAARDSQARGIAADQAAVVTAQKNLDTTNASVAASLPGLLEAVEKAKTSLWSTQISRDVTCSRSKGTDCESANANVASGELGVVTAQDSVKQGQVQGQQQIATAQTQLDQANQQLGADTAKLAEAVTSAQDQLNQATTTLGNARTGVVQAQHKATATVDTSRAQADQAQHSETSAEANYELSTAPPDPADVAAAQAQVANAQAAVDTAQANLDAATLTAPADATVSAINGSVGQFVSGGPVAVGDTPLFTLIDLNNLKVTASVNEADIGQVQVGDPVTFTVNAFPNKTFTGKVVTIQPQGTVVQNVVNYAVTCAVDPAHDVVLFPGMTAMATIVTDQRAGVLRIPNTALTFGQNAARQGLLGGTQARPSFPTPAGTPVGRRAGQPTPVRQPFAPGTVASGTPTTTDLADGTRGLVLALVNGQLVPTRVTVGITDGTDTEVLSGLTAGEAIVVGENSSTTATTAQRTAGPAAGGGPLGNGFGR